jgi:hypothetical protein
MYGTRIPFDIDRTVADKGVESRLNALIYANQWEANRQQIFRNAREEEEMLLMRRPIAPQKAFALFGLLLGAFPPAAIFVKLFGGTFARPFHPVGWFLLLCMNVVCCWAGKYLGSKLAHMVLAVERDSWALMLIESLIIGFIWAIGAGAAGGFLAFGIGAVYGAACAIPVGMLAFGLFVPLHRLLARGGMIDARHFWPLACGVVMMIIALILGL